MENSHLMFMRSKITKRVKWLFVCSGGKFAKLSDGWARNEPFSLWMRSVEHVAVTDSMTKQPARPSSVDVGLSSENY